MSVNPISTDPKHFTHLRFPSSILSSDSDIRFTRRKLTSQYRCGCCIIATFLLLLLVAGATVYVAYTYFMPDTSPEQVFRVTFRVTEGDSYSPDLTNPLTSSFKSRSRNYSERLNLLFRRSPVSQGFKGSEVLALDGTEDEDLIVHLNVHIDTSYMIVKAKDMERILSKEIVQQSLFFKGLTIDVKSLEVELINLLLDATSSTLIPTVQQAVTKITAPLRKCAPLQVEYCSKLSYNITTYPNLISHKNIKEVNDDLIQFRELVDAECYRHAYEFVCRILQPSCIKDEIVLPCRSFCRDFTAGCGDRLPVKLKNVLDCSKFPEIGCASKPGCVKELQSRALSTRLCDGIVDCQDVSDEKSCTYCPKTYMHCGIGRICIPRSKRCDGRQDCPDGSDERACLGLTPNVETIRQIELLTPHLNRYYSEGFVVFNEKGEISKLCTENLNQSFTSNKTTEIIHTVASSLCKTLTYRDVLSVQVETNFEKNISYVSMKDPAAVAITLVRSSCEKKQVLRVACSNLECGVQIIHGLSGLQALPKMANHGDWPWHVSLFKENVHTCDGTVISLSWILTTTSCFQGQPKAKWTVRFGSIRIFGNSPWQQERTIVGMVKSPVEGSTIAMVKVDHEIVFSDFVRPICLPDGPVESHKRLDCNTLGWARNREQLQRIQVKITQMAKCENVSISTVNSICTETYYGKDDCNEEEFAGAPLVCQNSRSSAWTLIGITNWRIACSNNSAQRPRMYDTIASNTNWIRDTMYSDREIRTLPKLLLLTNNLGWK